MVTRPDARRVIPSELSARLDGVSRMAQEQRAELSQLIGHERGLGQLTEWVSRLQLAGNHRHYKAFDGGLLEVMKAIAPVEESRIWHRLLLLEALARFSQSKALFTLPLLVQHYQLLSLERMLTTDTDHQASWLTLSSDRYCKDLGLATLALAAAGTRVAEVRSAIPRRCLVQGSPADLIEKSAFIMKQGGFRHYIQTHIHDPQIGRLEEHERHEHWRCCALLCRAMPSLKGFIGFGWLLDPELSWVSPRIFESGSLPLRNGAKVFRLGVDPEMTTNALATSKTRRALYESGRYQPANWLRIWPRRALIHWANSLGLDDDQPILDYTSALI